MTPPQTMEHTNWSPCRVKPPKCDILTGRRTRFFPHNKQRYSVTRPLVNVTVQFNANHTGRGPNSHRTRMQIGTFFPLILLACSVNTPINHYRSHLLRVASRVMCELGLRVSAMHCPTGSAMQGGKVCPQPAEQWGHCLKTEALIKAVLPC